MGFDFQVVYRPRKENAPADALSRCEDGQLLSLVSITKPVFGLLRSLRRLFAEQPEASHILRQVQEHPEKHEQYKVKEGLVLFKGHIWVTHNPILKDIICQEFHDSPLGGHAGIRRTLARIAPSFYWPLMRSDITSHVRKCITCQ